MYIYNAEKSTEYIAIVPRDFRNISRNALEIMGTDIKEALSGLGAVCYSEPVLHTPFCGELAEGGAPFFIAACVRRPSIFDKLAECDDLFGLLPVKLNEREVKMLYSVQYPGREIDREAVADVLRRQSAFADKLIDKKEQ